MEYSRRGIRHGDTLSALLFIIHPEPFAQKIRDAKNLKGIKMANGEFNF